MSESLYPVTILLDELKNDEPKVRLNSIKQLHTIAIALGEERTRNELIPFLTDMIDDEDEILIALADSLSDFVNYVGGPAYATCLIKPLESLVAIEENAIREKALYALKKIFKQLPIKTHEKEIIDILRRLFSANSFSSKISCINLFPILFPIISNEVANELINIIKQSSKSEIHQLRKSALILIKELVMLVPKFPESEIISLFNNFVSDENESVRLCCPEVLTSMSKIIPWKKNLNEYKNYAKLFSEDKSWRIRFSFSDNICDLIETADEATRNEFIAPLFASLLKDSESEVRTSAASKYSHFCKMINKDTIISKIIPCLNDISKDPFSFVRKAISENLLILSPILGGKLSSEHIIPIFLTLLRDENSEVRIPLLKNLEHINQLIGIDTLSQSIIPAFQNMAEDKNWRIRFSIL